MLYKFLDYPLLEYSSTVWSPTLKKDVEALEKVQRRMTKLLPGISHLTYVDRMKYLNLPSLSQRRKRANVLQVYRVQAAIDDLRVEASFLTASHLGTKGHSKKIFKPQARTTVRQQSWSNRVVHSWNSLPDNVVNNTL